MREIKFRAWDKLNRKMVNTIQTIGLGYENYATQFSRNWLYNSDDWDDEEGFIEAPMLMQYTGLKDKNGVEVYEGDIVKVPEEYPSGESKGEIIFINGIWYIDGDVSDGLWECNYNYGVEVIGNIYENPELIKE